MRRLKPRGVATAVLVAATALAAAALAVSERGRFPDPLVPRQAPTVVDQDPDRVRTAFVNSMAWQQLYAVTLAGGGRDYAQHRPLKQLSKAMVGVRTRHLETLRSLGMQREASVPLPYFYPYEALGLDSADLGALVLDPTLVRPPLELPAPSDRAFIDVTVANSLGAVRIADATLEVVRTGPVAELAREILTEEKCVIDALNEWRARWFGFPSPESRTSALATTGPSCRSDGLPAAGRPRS